MNIADIDTNLRVEAQVREEGLLWLDVRQRPFGIHGVIPPDKDGNPYLRIPAHVAAGASPGVEALNRHTAGGRVRFRTDSPYVAVAVRWEAFSTMPHMAATGSSGLSLYRMTDGTERFAGTYIPGREDGFEGVIRTPSDRMYDYTLYLPLYNDVRELYVGLHSGYRLEPATPYDGELPIVCYGSSITQGGCASRPGMDYEGILSRRLHLDYLNLGFSGSARGEASIARYIAGLKMSLLVLDYDHNAPDPEHLAATHEPFFRIIREARPDLPVLLVSAPFRQPDEPWKRRRDIIRGTYEHAAGAGDRHVYFIDGSSFYRDLVSDDATVDGIHPTDLGFTRMADGMEPVIRQALRKM